MDDFFTNYVFHKKENWNNLRDIVNIILEAYAARYNRQDGFHTVDGDIAVHTQYEHYLKNTTKQPIAIRASNYSGLAINKSKEGARVSQIWLLAENDDNVLCGQVISNFRMREDNTGAYYPREINIMFVSLPRLAEGNGLSGELSRLLLGSVLDPVNSELKTTANMFRTEYESFKENEEVLQSMTVLEERYAEGREEGIAIGEARADTKAEELFNARMENLIITKIMNNESLVFVRAIGIGMGLDGKRIDELIDRYKAR